MDQIDPKTYLKDYNKAKKSGTCIACSKTVQWGRERIAAHKRGNCPNISAEEKALFAKRKISDVHEDIGPPSLLIGKFV